MFLKELVRVAGYASVLGPLSHLLVWIRFEPDSFLLQLLILIITFAVSSPFAIQYRGSSVSKLITQCTIFELVYVLSLLASIGVYRAFWHPLNNYPGPFWAKVSGFWKVKHYSTYHGFRVIDDVHRKYGPVVRIGPRHLSINEPAGVSTAYNFPKPKVFEQVRKTIVTLADPQEHKARRAAWDHGLNGKACMSYLPLMNIMAKTLCEHLTKSQGSPMVVNQLCHYYTSDVISELAFGSSFDQLKTLRSSGALQEIAQFLGAGVLVLNVPWVIDIFNKIPGVKNPMQSLVLWTEQRLQERESARASEKSSKVDIMSYIEDQGDALDSRWPLTFEDICEDAVTMIIGGTDTSQSVISNGLHYLANDLELQEKLRGEILMSFPEGESDDPVWSKLSSANGCPYLDAFVNEILRHMPPVLQGTFRETPNYPVEIAGHPMPPKTIITCPIWTLHHDERCFKSAEQFIPERWLDKSHPANRADLVIDRRGFVPFLMGPGNCAGRMLAYMEIKVCFAHMLKRFKIMYAADRNLKEVTQETRQLRDTQHDDKVRDYLTMWAPDVEVCFLPLASSSSG